jgi:hypothetical protein
VTEEKKKRIPYGVVGLVGWTMVIAGATVWVWHPLAHLTGTLRQLAGLLIPCAAGLPMLLFDRLRDAAIVVALFWIAWGLGKEAVRLLARAGVHWDASAIEAVALGHGVLVLWGFFLACCKCLWPAVLAASVLGAAAWRLGVRRDDRFLLEWVRGLAQGSTASATKPRRTGALAATAAAFLGVALLVSLHPVWFFDTLACHFGTPRRWLLDGGFVLNLHDVFSLGPGQSEMLNAYALALGDVPAAQLFNFAALLVVVLWLRSQIAAPARHAAVLLLVSTPVVLMTATQGKPDLLLALYASLAFTRALKAVQSQDTTHFAMAGLFCGLAVATKYTAVAIVVAPIVLGWI